MTISLVAKLNEHSAGNFALYRHTATFPHGRMLFQSCAPDDGAEFILAEVDFVQLLGVSQIRTYNDAYGAAGESVCLCDSDIAVGDYPALLTMFMRGSLRFYVWLPIIGDRPMVPAGSGRCRQSAELRASKP
jgi:hypothetical protein